MPPTESVGVDLKEKEIELSDLPEHAEYLLSLLWSEFKRHHRWPKRKPVVVALHARGMTLQEATNGTHEIWSMGGADEVRASFNALAQLPEVARLFEPLPGVLRLAAERFVQKPQLLDGGDELRLTLTDLRAFWSTDDEALLAMAVMKETNFHALSWGGSTGPELRTVFFRPSIENLRYEHVRTLGEVLAVPKSEPRTDVGAFPSGRHLELLRQVFAHAQKHHAWPLALPFAIENRSVGFVPQLMADLDGRFVRGHFGTHRDSTIQLKPLALPFVDGDGSGRRLIVAIAKKVAALWKRSEGDDPIGIDELASEVGTGREALEPWLLFLGWEGWGSCRPGDHRNPAWTLSAREEVLRNERIDSWEEYVNLWHSETSLDWTGGAVLPVGGEQSAEEVTHADRLGLRGLPLDVLRSPSLRRVVERDLLELAAVVNAGAWKASLIIAGGVAEAALVDVLDRRQDLASSHMRKHKKWPEDVGLGELIEIAERHGLVQSTIKHLVGVAKEYRDLIHPVNAARTALRPDQTTTEAVIHALKMILGDLDEARRDGRISSYETVP